MKNIKAVGTFIITAIKNTLYVFSVSAIIVLVLSKQCQAGELFLDIGIGHKLQEQHLVDLYTGEEYDNDSPTAHFSIGYHDTKRNFTIAVAHDSNWLSGYPFNGAFEYHRTEIRFTKRFSLLKF